MPMPVYVPVQGAVIVPDALSVTAVVVPTITTAKPVAVVVQPASNAVVITPNNHGPRQPGLVLGVDGAKWFFGHGPPTI